MKNCKRAWRAGGGYSPLSEQSSPCRKVTNYFSEIFGIYNTLKEYPESCILAPSSEELAPCRKIPRAAPVNLQEWYSPTSDRNTFINKLSRHLQGILESPPYF